MAQSKVTIIAQLQDRMTGPLKKAQKQVEDTTKSVVDHGKKAEKAHDQAADAVGKQAKETDRAASKIDRALNAVTGSASGMGKEFKQTEGKVDKALDAMVGDAKDSSNRIDKALAAAGEQGGRGMVSNLKAAGTKFVSEARSIGREAGDKMAAGIESALASIDTSGISGAIGGASVIGGVTASLQRDSTSRAVSAAGGHDPEEMRDLIDSAYRDNFGADYESAAATAGTIVSTFDVEPGSEEAARLMRGNLTLEKVFGLDPQFLALGVKVFMDADDLSAQQAQDVMAGVLQRAAPAVRDELLDNINEYIPNLADTGISGTGIATFMADASNIGGVYGSDKTGDLMKEWQIIARDPSKDQEKAYAELGLDPAEITSMMNEGRGDEAFRMVAEAVNTADPADQGRLAIGVYGTPIEDLGLGKIEEYTGMWKEAATEASAYEGVMGGIQGTMQEGEGAAFGRMIRAAGESIVAIGDEIAPILTPFFEALTNLAPAVGPVLALFTGISALKFAKKGLSWLGGFADNLDDVGKNGGKARGAMGGLRAVMIGHPLLTAAAVVWGLGDALGWAYENIDWVKREFDIISDAIQGALGFLEDFIGKLDSALAKATGLEGFQPAQDLAADWTGFGENHRDKAIEEATGYNKYETGIGWIDDPTRAARKGLGVGEFFGTGEGWLSFSHGSEANADKDQPAHALGGWTAAGAHSATVGENGREFVTNAWASQKIESASPGALAYMNATGQLPTATTGGGDTVIVNVPAGADASIVPLVTAAVERGFAARDKRRSRTHATPTARGAH